MPAFGRLVAVEARLEGEYRAGIGRIGGEAEEIAYAVFLDAHAQFDIYSKTSMARVLAGLWAPGDAAISSAARTPGCSPARRMGSGTSLSFPSGRTWSAGACLIKSFTPIHMLTLRTGIIRTEGDGAA